jgi:phosphoribosylaminoimidazole-succinocarboxamide synthase
MLTPNEIKDELDNTFKGLGSEDILGKKIIHGKVREIIDLGESLILSTSDRISAFDRILSTIPFKGEILNGISNYWFDNTRDIIDNHIISKISPRAIHVKKCKVLPVEVIIRGYLTGSAWRDYKAGKTISGIALPTGLKMDEKFETPILTPSTKAEQGDHDEPISSQDIVARGLVSKDLWEEVTQKALQLFKRGTELASQRGLILVDTKYEFGILDDKLVIVDEIHTPDSSRYWYQDSYVECFEKGESQRKVDKEFLRQWLMDRGFMGDGESPEIKDDLRVEIAKRYIEAYELITGNEFVPSLEKSEAEKEKITMYIGKL